jgi:GNAT superfamily N-acetyltransferase
LKPAFSLKRVEPADADHYAGVVTAIHPDETADPDLLRARWRNEGSDPGRQSRYLVLDGERVGGLAFWALEREATENEVHLANVNVRLVPERQSEDEFDWILRRMETESASAGARIARAVTREDEPFHRRNLTRNGYHVDRISRSWTLNLVTQRQRLIDARSASRDSMTREHISNSQLSSVEGSDAWSRLYDLMAETVPDIPTTIREPIPSREAWMLKMHAPDIHADRIWTALKGSKLVGFSYLSYPAVGDVWTGYTAVARECRGLGIARALKLETIGQAIDLDIRLVKTNNDVENSAILHINESLGYEAIPGFISHLKSLG